MINNNEINKILNSALRKIKGQTGYYNNSDLYVTGKELTLIHEITETVNKLSVEAEKLNNASQSKRRI